MVWLRNLLAVVLGAAATGFVVLGVQVLGHRLFPSTAPMDPSNLEVMRTFVQSLPTGALLFVLLAWTLGAFVGSLVAIKTAHSHKALFAWFVGGLTLAMVGVNTWQIPHPTWMVAAGVLLPLAAVALAVRWQAPRTPPATTLL